MDVSQLARSPSQAAQVFYEKVFTSEDAMNTGEGGTAGAAVSTGAEAPAGLPQDWVTFIGPFATSIGMSVEEVTEAMSHVVGEPGADAIALLQNEGDTPFDLVRERFTKVASAKFKKALGSLRKAPEVAAAQPVMQTAFNALPEVPADDAWLKSLQTGGVLKVGKPTVIAAVRAGLGDRLSLFDLPSTLVELMEATAETLEEPVGPEFFKVRKLLTQKRYAEIFAALGGAEGLDAKFVTQGRKDKFLARLSSELWPALIEFQAQLRSWVDSWQSQMANPATMMGMLAGLANGGAGAVMPPNMIAPPVTDALRDAAQGVVDKINRTFAGLGTPIAAALAYEAMQIREVLENPSLPLLVGAPNREQMLRKCNVAVSADYVRLEKGLTQYVLGVMDLPDVPAGQDIPFIGALFQLGAQIPWGNLQGSAKRNTRPRAPFSSRDEE